MLHIPLVTKVANGLEETASDELVKFVDINELYRNALCEHVIAGDKSLVEEIILDIMAVNQLESPSTPKLVSLHTFLNEYRDDAGDNLFLLAVRANKIKIVRLLLDYGANLYSKNSHTGRTAFLFAHMHGESYLSMKMFLLRKRMAACACYKNSRTILAMSVRLSFDEKTARYNYVDSFLPFDKPEKPLTDLQVLMQQKDQYMMARGNHEMSLVIPCQNLPLLSSLWQPFIHMASTLKGSVLNSMADASSFFFNLLKKYD